MIGPGTAPRETETSGGRWQAKTSRRPVTMGITIKQRQSESGRESAESAAPPALAKPRTFLWILLLAVVVGLFFWKILFTNQLSILAGWEGANQTFAWYQFATHSVQQHVSPVWDPYQFSGHSFVGEMQAGLFYPLKLLLYLWPLGPRGIVSERLLDEFYVLAHLLGACFLFFLAREIGLKKEFSAFVAAICFSLGGFVGKQNWFNMMDSAIWLPLIFLLLLRALREERSLRGALYACLSGLCLGMSLLAGSLHVAIMQSIVVVSAAMYFAWQRRSPIPTVAERAAPLMWCLFVAVAIGLLAAAAGAIQLLPSMEYGRLVTRWTGTWSGPAYARIPYSALGEVSRLTPRSVFAFLFGAANVGDSEFSNYFGVMPFLLTVLGVWLNWEKPWVKYLTGLGIVAYFYSMGSSSFLHGVLYVLAPGLDKAREPGRFIYLTHFSMALLAGYGVESLFSGETWLEGAFSRLKPVLKWMVIAVVVTLGVPALLWKPDVYEWAYMSLLFMLGSWALFLYVTRGNRGVAAKFLLVALILCDLNAFDWTILNRDMEKKSRGDYLEQIVATRNLANFFQSQKGLFRIQWEGERMPVNMGDIYQVPVSNGQGATMLFDYPPYTWTEKGLALLNVRYLVGELKDRKDSPVYASGPWKVYENPAYCPRAWVVHRFAVKTSAPEIQEQIQRPEFDPLRMAFVDEAPPLEPSGEGAGPSSAIVENYQNDAMKLRVTTQSPGLLVLSEMYYPGWEAAVNGKFARIYKVDGILRGIAVPGGESRVELRYRPLSVRLGAALSIAAFAGTFLFAGVLSLKKRALKKRASANA